MRPFFGGIVGLALGLTLYVVIAQFFSIPIPAFLAVLTALILFILSPFVAGLSILDMIVIAAFIVVLATVFAYVIATISLIPLITVTPPGPLPVSPFEELMRGFIIGLTAVLNFSLWAFIGGGALLGYAIGFLVALIGFLAVFTFLSRSLPYQIVLGWTSWIMPMSYLATTFGILLFILNLPSALATFGLASIRLDFLTGTIETTGGTVASTRLFGSTSPAFNLGNFTFLTPPARMGLAFRTSFGNPGISAHETGHTLTVAAFGGIFGWINAVDENLPPFRRGFRAYGELVPESHFPRRRLHVRVWS